VAKHISINFIFSELSFPATVQDGTLLRLSIDFFVAVKAPSIDAHRCVICVLEVKPALEEHELH
jgi:hypothetical protein